MHYLNVHLIVIIINNNRVTPHEDVCLVVVCELKTHLEWFDSDIVT